MQACRDSNGRRRDIGGRSARFAFALGLEHRLGHLLDEERNAVRALDDVLSDAGGQRLVADDPVDHGIDVAPRQAVDRERRHVRPSDPGRIELRPEGHDQQNAQARDPLHRAAE